VPGLGARLRARWRALIDATWLQRRQTDDSGDITDGSQHPDTEVVDLRPRVRMPGPDAGSEGPPAEWLAYVMAQDPVWIDGGLGLSGRAFDKSVRDPSDVSDLSSDVSTQTSDAGSADPPAVTASRPVADRQPGPRARARFVRPSPRAEVIAPDPAPAPAPAAAPVRASRRLLPRYEPAPSAEPVVDSAPSAIAARADVGTAASNDPAPRTAAIRHDDLPVWSVWPVAVSAAVPTPPPTSTPGLHAVPDPRANSLTASESAVLVHAARATVTAPAPRTLAAHPYPHPTAAHIADRSAPAIAQPYVRPAIDPWASVSSPAPVVELRRDPDDRPVAADPPVALRWRAIDLDRLALEQRAL